MGHATQSKAERRDVRRVLGTASLDLLGQARADMEGLTQVVAAHDHRIEALELQLLAATTRVEAFEAASRTFWTRLRWLWTGTRPTISTTTSPAAR
jgi:hypothetical protein